MSPGSARNACLTALTIWLSHLYVPSTDISIICHFVSQYTVNCHLYLNITLLYSYCEVKTFGIISVRSGFFHFIG